MERGTCWLNKYQQEIIRVISNCVWLESFSRSRPVNTNRGIFRKANLFYLLFLLSAALSVHLVLRLHILCLLMRDAAKFSVWVVVCCHLKCEVMSWQEIILCCSLSFGNRQLHIIVRDWRGRCHYLPLPKVDQCSALSTSPTKEVMWQQCYFPGVGVMIPNVENLSLAKASTDPIPNPVLFSGKWFYLRGAGSTKLLWFSRCAVSHIFYEIRNLHA